MVGAPVADRNVTAASPATTGSLLDYALSALAAGLSVVPPRMDGSKIPIVEWKELQGGLPIEDRVRTWYRAGQRQTGIGYVCGAVSGNLELFDFDDHDAYERFRALAIATGLGDVVERIEAGYLEQSPTGGVHWLYRCSEIGRNTKLARRPREPDEQRNGDDRIKCLIETRGEGGYVVAAPSYGRVHPTGRPYQVLRGGLETIVEITPDERAELMALARTLDAMPVQKFNEPRPAQPRSGGGDRPGDAFNNAQKWGELLGGHGWTVVTQIGEETLWKRPGSANRWSASTNYHGNGLFYVWTTSTEFESEKTYSAFAVYTLLNHGGDWTAAARELGRLGYGEQHTNGHHPVTNGTANISTNGLVSIEPPPATEIPTWPDPDPVLAPFGPVEPIETRLFPKELEHVAIDAAERMQTPVDYVIWPLLVSLAALVGRDAGIRPRAFDDWTERTALWVAVIGPSSQLKTPAINEGVRPLRRQEATDRERFEKEVADWEDRCAEIRRKNPKTKDADLPNGPDEFRWLVGDVTVERLAMLLAPGSSRGLTVHRDELASVLLDLNRYRAKGSGSDRQFFLEAYNGGPYRVDRVGRPGLFVRDLLLNIVGGLQPDVARDLFSLATDDGFNARITAIWPDVPSTWRKVDRWPDQAARAALDRVNDVLARAAWSELLQSDAFSAVPYARFTPDAQAVWDQWYEGFMLSRSADAEDAGYESRRGKYPGLVARITLAFHLHEWAAGRSRDARTVESTTLADVLDLLETYIIPMDQRVYRQFREGVMAEGGKKIAQYIIKERLTGITPRQVYRHQWQKLRTPKECEEALDWLASHHWVREFDREERPGRPTRLYTVNPKVLEGNHG